MRLICTAVGVTLWALVAFRPAICIAATAPAQPAAPAAAPAAAPGDAPPTVEQLRDLLAQQKYADVQRGVARNLAIKGAAAQNVDRYEMLMLRGEAFLRTRSNTPAADAFAAAQKETTDAEKKDIARANELLVRHSKGSAYPVKGSATTRPAMLPIVEPTDRKTAFEALLADMQSSSERTLAAGAAAKTLPPVLDAARAMVDLSAVEFAASGKNEQTRAAAAQLGQHAHVLIHDATTQMIARNNEIWKWATKQFWQYDQRGMPVRFNGYQGLDPAGQHDLQEMVSTCAKIMAVSGDLATVTGNEDLRADGERARKLGTRCEGILNIKWHYTNSSELPALPTVE